MASLAESSQNPSTALTIALYPQIGNQLVNSTLSPFIKVLPKNTKIYRSQNRSIKTDGSDHISMFYTSSYAAPLYADTTNPSTRLFSMTFKDDLKLFVITPQSLASLNEVFRSILNSTARYSQYDQIFLNEFLHLFGHNPYLEFDSKGKERFPQEARRWEYHYTRLLLSTLDTSYNPGEPELKLIEAFFPALSLVLEHTDCNTSRIEEENSISSAAESGPILENNSPIASGAVLTENSSSEEDLLKPRAGKKRPLESEDKKGIESIRERVSSRKVARTKQSPVSLRSSVNLFEDEIEKDISAIKLSSAFPAPFRRVSSTSADYNAFRKLFNKAINNENLNGLFDAVDGFYIPPCTSPVYNFSKFITQSTRFHEEVVLNPKVFVPNPDPSQGIRFTVKEECWYRRISDKGKGAKKEVAIPHDSSFRVTGLFQTTDAIRGRLLKAFKIPETRYSGTHGLQDPLLDPAGPELEKIAYIYAINRLYVTASDTLFTVINSYEDNQIFHIGNPGVSFEGPYPNTMFFDYREYGNEFSSTLERRMNSIMQHIFDMIETFYILNPKLFIFKDAEPNPFLKGDGLNHELFYFTCVSDPLKYLVAKFSWFLTTVGLDEFMPVASGGILFGAYTIGDFRRLTKDIDLKIGAQEFIPKSNQEKKHFQLSLAIMAWNLLSINLLNKFGVHRIKRCIDYYKLAKPAYQIERIPIPREFVIRCSPTYTTIDPLKCAQYLLFLDYPDFYEKDLQSNPRGLFFQNFDLYLRSFKGPFSFSIGKQTAASIKQFFEPYSAVTLYDTSKWEAKSVASFQAFLKERKRLLDTKKDIQEQLMRARIESSKRRLEIQKGAINSSLRKLEQIVSAFLELFSAQYKLPLNLNRQITYLKKLFQERPNVGFLLGEDVEYKIGHFASLWIDVDSKERYGLIDYTMDTQYACKGTFTLPSKLLYSGINFVSPGPIAYGSFLHFLRESSKLVTICDPSKPYFGDTFQDDGGNVFNRCAPSKAVRDGKVAKYNERYSYALRFCRAYLASFLEYHQKGPNPPIFSLATGAQKAVYQTLITTIGSMTLEDIIAALEKCIQLESDPNRKKKAEKFISILLTQGVLLLMKDKPMVGSGRRATRRNSKQSRNRRATRRT